MSDQIPSDTSNSPAADNSGDQGYDPQAAMSSMRAYGLDPAGDDAIDYARAWLEDAERNDPHNRDRYSRAAQAAATAKRQAQAMQAVEDFGLKGKQLLDAYNDIARFKAERQEAATRQTQSVLDTNDPHELFRMAQGKIDQDPSDLPTGEAWRRMQAAGVNIEDGDPEAKNIDTSSPERFLASIDRAIAAKRSRHIQDITDPGELFKMAKEQGLI